MTREQLLGDQRYIFQDLPTEQIVIGVQNIACIVLGAREGNRWEDGGLLDTPGLTVAIQRQNLGTMPRAGEQAMFREISYSIASVSDDHDTSPIRIELEGVAGRK